VAKTKENNSSTNMKGTMTAVPPLITELEKYYITLPAPDVEVKVSCEEALDHKTQAPWARGKNIDIARNHCNNSLTHFRERRVSHPTPCA